MTIKRLEIPKLVKFEVFRRAGGPDMLHCEGCSRPLRLGEAFDYDHTIPEWMRSAPPSERKITADDVKLLGRKCCHQAKTAKESGQRAHGNRIIIKAASAGRKSRPIPGSKASGFRCRLNGQIERR